MEEETKEQVNEEVAETSEDITEEELELDNETFTYTVDNNNIGKSTRKNDDNKSLIYMIIGIALLIIIIIFIVIVANKGKSLSNYEEVENKMVEAAKNYYKDNESELPTTDGEKTTIQADTLISNNYMKPFTEFFKENETCNGYVEVYKIEEYEYFATLECTNYKTEKLSEKIISDEITTTGDGLYENAGEYIFKGEFPNNNVTFDGKKWRIIKINNDKSIKMILTEKEVERNAWDDRYNSTINSNVGINDFRVSRALEFLKASYENKKIITKKNTNLLVKGKWCIGKLTQEDTPISELNLCSDTYDDLYIGLVTVDEVLNASLDQNCKNIYDGECTNYNYFMYIPSTWTISASADKTYKVFAVNSGLISVKDASMPNNIRAVININSNVTIKKGTGTENDPYVIGN